MSNRYRFQDRGTAHHVNIKAVAGVHAFPDNAHRDFFLELLEYEIVASKWSCLSYTIMGTHYHVAVELEDLTLSSGFQRLSSRYARWFNRQHGRTGALWQARFYDVLIETDLQLLETERYIALNAKKAGLVAEPEDWPYCSYGATVGRFPKDPLVESDVVLRLLSRNPRVARARLRAFVNEPDRNRRRQMFLRARSEQAQTKPTRATRVVKDTLRSISSNPNAA